MPYKKYKDYETQYQKMQWMAMASMYTKKTPPDTLATNELINALNMFLRLLIIAILGHSGLYDELCVCTTLHL